MNQPAVMFGVIKATWLDGATLPDQYQLDNTWGVKQPLDNVWNDPSTGNGQPTDRVDGTLSSGSSFINWFYRNTGTGYNPLEGGMTSMIINSFDRPAALVECDDYSNRQDREDKFGDVVRDQLEFDEYEAENIYTVKSSTYHALNNDTTILNQGDTADYIFQQFYINMQNSNIGLFVTVDELTSDTLTLPDAASLNETIIDTNSIEYFRKQVNEIYLATIANGLSLNGVDSTMLENTAYSNLVTTGEAVYLAASMLGMEVHPAYNAGRKAKNVKSKPVKNFEQLPITVIPNPAAEHATVTGELNSIQKILLMAIDGRRVREFCNNLHQLNLEGISSGLYLLKFVTSNNEIRYLNFGVVK